MIRGLKRTKMDVIVLNERGRDWADDEAYKYIYILEYQMILKQKREYIMIHRRCEKYIRNWKPIN
jgi:hypothetical protein